MGAGTQADPMIPRKYRVMRIQRETPDTVSLTVSPADDGEPLAFAPGQFNMLYCFGVGEVPISLSGDPSQPSELVHTVRKVGAVTQALCSLKRGSVLGLRGPFGNPWPVEAAFGHDVVLVAGGLGLAPLRPALLYILMHRSRYGRVALLYGARSPADRLYSRQLEQWSKRRDLDVLQIVDVAPASWHGHVGLVTSLIPRLPIDPLHGFAFLCGPEVMMRFSAMELQRLGVKTENIYVSMERNMKCAVGYCGHCQFGPAFVCKDGPVFRYDRIAPFFHVREM